MFARFIHNLPRQVPLSEGIYMNADAQGQAYQPPALRVLGSVQELTQGCVKVTGGSDGFSFDNGQQTVSIVCRSG